jgi:hypothetical protein
MNKRKDCMPALEPPPILGIGYLSRGVVYGLPYPTQTHPGN